MPGRRAGFGGLLGAMAMEPVLLVCGGCRARIRVANPALARGRDCPRCSTPLAASVDALARTGPVAGEFPDLADEREAWADVPRKRPLRLATGAAALVATLASLASLALRDPSPGELTRPRPIEAPAPAPPPVVTVARVEALADETDAAPEAPDDDPVPDLTPAPGVRPADLALRDSGPGRPPSPPPALSREDEPEARPRADSTPPPAAVPTPPPGPEAGPRRLLVHDSRGRAIIAREHGMCKERMAVILPDGQVGWPDGLFFTDLPFLPVPIGDLRRKLQDEEFPTSRVIQTDHYLVFYQGSEPFARASADLLEKLHVGLTETLKKHKIPASPAEFPLVAVIYRTEDDFRADRKVAADVQAYYEILTNRIYFYETSRRDGESPEVSALRKPQTVAHEGTHQILQNVGIQPRLSNWPLWLVEGFAEYCSPPKATRKGSDWAGLGQVNPIHMATIRDLDDPASIQVRGASGPRIGRDRKTPLVQYLVTREELTPTDYALSWALTHYLAYQRFDEFVGFLKRMGQLKPFEERAPEQHLAAFREAFGDDLAKMDGRVAKYLAKLKVPDSQSLPFYAVMFEQPINAGAIRRAAMVSQSPSMIRQWLDNVARTDGGPGSWRSLPFPSHARALMTARQWMEGQ